MKKAEIPGQQQLWVPGQNIELHEEYPVPAQSQLENMWRNYLGHDQVEPAPGVYGAVRTPEEPPSVYASIDVCEILRETHRTMRLVEEVVPGLGFASIHAYCEGLSIKKDITSVLQVMMNADLIGPVSDIKDIADILRGWRNDGVYVVANTSTLPGCEPGTIRFFKRYLPDCFDGLLLPRNHDGSLPATKGFVARQLAETLSASYEGRHLTALHIDDTPHHNQSFRYEMGMVLGARVATFMPEYPSHYPPDTDSHVAATPLEAFRAADAFLAQAGRLAA